MSLSSPYGSRVIHKKGTLRDSLHKRAETTLSREGISNAVVCPEDVDKNEWIAVHAIDFYNDICMLYSIVHEECTVNTCQCMSAGSGFEFLWIDKQRYKRPTRLPARIYIDYLLNWLVTQFEDETLFPVKEGVPFPPDYEEQVRSMFRRMFRVFAHIWCNHKEMIKRCNCESSFRFSLTHYLFFVNQFNLVGAGDLRPLCTLVNELCPNLPLTIEMNKIENSKREHHKSQQVNPSTFQRLTATPPRSLPSLNRLSQTSENSIDSMSVSQRSSYIPSSRSSASMYYSNTNIPSNAISMNPQEGYGNENTGNLISSSVNCPASNPVSYQVNYQVNYPGQNMMNNAVSNAANYQVINSVNCQMSQSMNAPINSPINSPISNPVKAPVTNPIASPIANPIASPIANPMNMPMNIPVGNSMMYEKEKEEPKQFAFQVHATAEEGGAEEENEINIDDEEENYEEDGDDEKPRKSCIVL